MPSLILENYESERAHINRLTKLFQNSIGFIKIASPYITDRTLIQKTDKPIHILTNLNILDIVSGATSIEAISWMIANGVECRILPDKPRLHSKTYIFGSMKAVISSANLTMNALHSNIEAGVELDEKESKELERWFDSLWNKASPLSQDYLTKLSKHVSSLRMEYEKIRKKAQKELPSQHSSVSNSALPDSISKLFKTANGFFICNSNRKYSKKTKTGG